MAIIVPSTSPGYVRRGYNLAHGAVGGVVGGVVSGLVHMVVFRMFDFGGLWQPFNVIAGTFRPAWAEVAEFSLLPTLAGIAIHLVACAVLGVIIAWLIAPGSSALLRAVVMAMLVWVVVSFLFLPQSNVPLYSAEPAWALAVCAFAYGLGLGGYLAFLTPRYFPVV